MPFSKSSTWTTVVLSASCQQIRKTSGRIGVTAICTVSEVPLTGPSAVVSVITVSDSKWRWWTQPPKCASYTWPTAGKWIVDMGSSFPAAAKPTGPTESLGISRLDDLANLCACSPAQFPGSACAPAGTVANGDALQAVEAIRKD